MAFRLLRHLNSPWTLYLTANLRRAEICAKLFEDSCDQLWSVVISCIARLFAYFLWIVVFSAVWDFYCHWIASLNYWFEYETRASLLLSARFQALRNLGFSLSLVSSWGNFLWSPWNFICCIIWAHSKPRIWQRFFMFWVHAEICAKTLRIPLTFSWIVVLSCIAWFSAFSVWIGRFLAI